MIVALAAWGAHAGAPWRLAHGGAGPRRLWRLAAPLLFALGFIASLRLAAADPDRAVAAGLGALPFGSRLAAWASLAALAAAAADAVVAAAGERLEPWGWRLAALLAFPALAVFAWTSELMRAAAGAAEATAPLVAAAACRAAVGLAAADLAVPGRPVWAPAAGLGAALYALFVPAPLGAALLAQGDLLTLGAGAALLLVAPFAPARLRRAAAGVGFLLAAIGLARAGALSADLSLDRP